MYCLSLSFPDRYTLLLTHLIFLQTIVSMQCYTTHQDPTAFPNPESFLPERWMAPEGPTAEMKLLFMPFSKGTRACLGRNLAMLELKLLTVALLQRYVVAVSTETTAVGMEMVDHFLASPKAGRCDLIFHPVR